MSTQDKRGHPKWKPQQKCQHRDGKCYLCEGCGRPTCTAACTCQGGILMSRHEYLREIQMIQQRERPPKREAVTKNEQGNRHVYQKLQLSSQQEYSQSDSESTCPPLPKSLLPITTIEEVMHLTQQDIPDGGLAQYIPSEKIRNSHKPELLPFINDTTTSMTNNTATESEKMRGKRWSNLKKYFRVSVEYIENIFLPNADGTLIDGTLFSKENSRLHDRTQQFQDTCTTIFAKMPQNSTEKRVARAILCKSLPTEILSNNFSLTATKEVSFKKKAQTSAEIDFKMMMEGCTLSSKSGTFSRSRFNHDAVTEAVKFITQEDNLSILSWGAKEIKLSNEENVILSGMTRSKKRSDIFYDYKKKVTPPFISRSSFFDILNTITTGEETKISAVDYVVGILVNEPCETLQEIIDKFSSSKEINKMLTKHLSIVKNFLKHHYSDHARMPHSNSNGSCCGCHGLEYGLRKPTKDELAIPLAKLPTVRCDSCLFVDFFISEMLKMVEERKNDTNTNINMIEDAIQFIKDTDHKFVCFMQHRIRVANSENNLKKIEKEMVDFCLQEKKDCPKGLAIVDWKMKFNTESARKTTEEHFGDRGISWHGILLIYYRFINNKVVRHVSYIDQIQEGSNLQNGPHCLSMLEAAMIEISESVPHITSITLQSDNAGCYHHKIVKLGIFFLNEVLRVKILRYIHTETQAGKSLLDAHFGRCRHYIDRYLTTCFPNIITKIATAMGLVKALAWNGGLKNSSVQLIRHDSNFLETLMEETISSIAEESKKDFTRCNDIYYGEEKGKDGFYTITAYAYAGIGPGTQFRINFEKQLWERVEEVKEEANEEEIFDNPETLMTKMSAKQLRELCEARGMSKQGNKSMLAHRIVEWEQQEDQEADEPLFNPDDDHAILKPVEKDSPDFVLKAMDENEKVVVDDDDDDEKDKEDEDPENPTNEEDETALEQEYEREEDTEGEYSVEELEKTINLRERKLEAPPDTEAYRCKHKSGVEIVLTTRFGYIFGTPPKDSKTQKQIRIIPQTVQQPLNPIPEDEVEVVERPAKRTRFSQSMSPMTTASTPEKTADSQTSIIASPVRYPDFSNQMPPPNQAPTTPPLTQLSRQSSSSSTSISRSLSNSIAAPVTQLTRETSSGSGATHASVSSITSLVRAKNRTLKAFAVRQAEKWIGVNSMVSLFSKGDSDKNEKEFQLMRDSKFKFPVRKRQRQGHARRSVRGDVPLYGPTYAKNFQTEIQEFFALERKTKSLQYSAADMQQMLKSKYPNKFCLPTSHELRNAISAYVSKKKKGGDDETETETAVALDQEEDDNEEEQKEEAGTTVNFPPAYRKILEEWCRADDLTPAPALEKLKKQYGKNDDFPEDKAIKARVSQIRGKIKREMRRDLP